MVTRFGIVKVGRLSGQSIYDFVNVCRDNHVSVFDIYIYKRGLLSIQYGVTVRGEEKDIMYVHELINNI